MAPLAQRTVSALLSSTTFCVDDHVASVCRPMRKLTPGVERRVLEHPAASTWESPSIVTVHASSCGGNTPTRHVARGAGIVRVRSACCFHRCAVAFFASARDIGPVRHEICQVLLTRCDRPAAHPSGTFGTAWTRLWARRLKAELCHCQFFGAWVCFTRQSSVAVNHTAVQHDRLVVVSRSQPCLLHELGFMPECTRTMLGLSRQLCAPWIPLDGKAESLR